ncbi:MAG: acyl-CoA thioester hydrolase/BAAT C-terminal domain-containing protein [Anaerolineae bacterium]
MGETARDDQGLSTEVLLYPEAGRPLNAFYVPTLGLRDGQGLVLGGTPAATAHASVDSWAQTIAFFRSHCG